MFVLVSMIILGLSKWSFQWITNFVNYILNIQSYQNTNKTHISFKSLLVFGGVSIALECCKCARMRFRCATVLVVLSICATYRDPMQMDVQKTHYPFYTTKKLPHVTVTITKNASLAAIARYVSITTIYIVCNLQIFKAGHFFSSKYCNDLQRKKHWIAMVFNESTNYDFILHS